MLDAARSLGVTLIAHSPLAAGLLTGRFHDDSAQARSMSRTRRLGRPRAFGASGLARTAPLIEELRLIGRGHGASMAQVALNWLTNFYGDDVVAIPGASKPWQATELAKTMSFTFTQELHGPGGATRR